MKMSFRKGSVSDTETLIRFLNEIKNHMPQKQWFYVDPPELLRAMMLDGTMELWLAENQNEVAALFTILYPGLAEYNYGYDLNFSKSELLHVVHMDTAAVHPDYRGMGLQKKMMDLAERELSEKGNKILLTTVHPDNHYSLRNMLSLGYEIQARVRKYGSERYVLRKDIF